MARSTRITHVLLLVLLGLPAVAFAQSASGSGADELNEAAVDSLADFPWYDADTDGLRRLDVEPPSDVKNRNSKWLFNAPNWNLSMPDWLLLLLRILAWSAFALLIAALAYLLVRAFMNWEEGFTDRLGPEAELELGGDVDRVDALPFQLKRPQGDLLGEARRLYEAGRYAEAMIYLYSYQLVQLDKGHVIRLTRGKTNRQYLREVRRRSNLFELMRLSVETFEDVFFGNHPLDRPGFESCWNRLEEFHQQLDPEHAIA